MVEYFINGGPFMWPILILLLAGFGIVGERFYSLLSSSIDTSKFFGDVEETLNNNGLMPHLSYAIILKDLWRKFLLLDYLELIEV